MAEEETYEVTVNFSYTETFDVEATCEEEARERGYFVVKDDMKQGVIPVDAFDGEAKARKIEE